MCIRDRYDICKGLAHHGFKKIAMLNCHGGNSPIIQVLSRELRSELGIAVFIINCGAFFGNQAVKDVYKRQGEDRWKEKGKRFIRFFPRAGS